MTAVATVTMDVLGEGLGEDRIVELLRRRSPLGRVRELLGGGHGAVQVGPTLYWPVALVHATAEGAGRRPWTERTQGAVDLVSGRVGLVDLELPAPRTARLAERDCIPARVPRGAAELRWHEFFRDHVDRRRKPMRPPALRVDRIHQVWLPHHVASVGPQQFLVDGLTSRVDEVADFPYLVNLLADRQSRPIEGEQTCEA